MRVPCIPYIGSKAKYAEEIVSQMPSSPHIIDACCGGGAILTAILQSGKYSEVTANDKSNMAKVYEYATKIKKEDIEVWVGRDEFFSLGDSLKDTLLRAIFSFSSDMRTYIYAKENEVFLREFFGYVMNHGRGGLRERYLSARRIFGERRLRHVERIIQVEKLRYVKTGNMETLQGDYKDVAVRDDSIVYCDIPYKATTGYYKDKVGRSFDHDAFFDWARGVGRPVYVSEYNAPSDFVCLWQKNTRCTLCATDNSKLATEKLFIHNKWLSWHKNAMRAEQKQKEIIWEQ